ncbi:uncharacterized protein LOC142356484 isoform X2 [Convolutriloba macropyga]|uniref:uncharacterized protein LOC142356484 isoform X2 n=1 Tax=Convolutriloba macropyga TaxID=536237 RepID=UPI003F51BB81
MRLMNSLISLLSGVFLLNSFFVLECSVLRHREGGLRYVGPDRDEKRAETTSKMQQTTSAVSPSVITGSYNPESQCPKPKSYWQPEIDFTPIKTRSVKRKKASNNVKLNQVSLITDEHGETDHDVSPGRSLKGVDQKPPRSVKPQLHEMGPEDIAGDAADDITDSSSTTQLKAPSANIQMTTASPPSDEMQREPLDLTLVNSNVDSTKQPEPLKGLNIDHANNRNVRSTMTCGSCRCTEKTSDSVELTSCNIKGGFIEVSEVDYREVDLTRLLNQQTTQVDILIKDTVIETIKGLESVREMSHLILENNANLELKATGSLINVNKLQFRRKSLKKFDDRVFLAKKLIISNLIESSLADFAFEETWERLSGQIQDLVIEGEIFEIDPFKSYGLLQNVTMLNVVSKQSNVLSDDFLQSAKRLKIISLVNSSQISLPKHFSSGTGAQNVSFVLDANNIRQQALDEKKGVKALNGRTLSDSEKDILTSTSDSDKCKIFCVNDDCSKEANELWKLNCVICVRNNEGPDEELESRICNYKTTTIASSTITTIGLLPILIELMRYYLAPTTKSNKISSLNWLAVS